MTLEKHKKSTVLVNKFTRLDLHYFTSRPKYLTLCGERRKYSLQRMNNFIICPNRMGYLLFVWKYLVSSLHQKNIQPQ